MSSLHCLAPSAGASASAARQQCSRPCSRLHAAPGSARRSVAAQAAAPQAESTSTRREALGAVSLALAASLASAGPAQAFLGIGEDEKVQERYTEYTKEVLGKVRVVLDLPKDAPNKEDAVKELRKDINSWVAAYRREGKVAGKPSFGVVYSILNALAGHFNSFGPTAPIPKKRLERIEKEIKDAQLYLSRNR